MTGWFRDRFGQKTVFLVSVGGFTLASVWCGLSTSIGEIVVARLLQGVLGAALTPLAQTVLLDINPPEKHGSAMAVWGVGVMVGPILGPTVGGFITDTFNWRWVFFINIPIGILAFYGIWRYIRAVPGERRMNFDAFGFASLSLSVGALQMFLDRGEQNDWFSSTETWLELIVMAISFAYFVVHTWLTPAHRSFFDSRLLQNRNFVTGAGFTFLVGLLVFGSRVLLPGMLQNLLGYPVALTGLVTAPAGIGTAITMFLGGRLMGKVDLRLIVGSGLALTAVSLWKMTNYSLDLSTADIAWPSFIQGLGTGLIFVSLSTAAFTSLGPSLRAQGTAIFSLTRNLGNSIGISIVQALLLRGTQRSHAALVEHVTYDNPAWNHAGVAAVFNLNDLHGAAALDAVVTQQAAMIAYINDFWFMCILTLVAMPLVLLIKSTRRKPTAEESMVIE